MEATNATRLGVVGRVVPVGDGRGVCVSAGMGVLAGCVGKVAVTTEVGLAVAIGFVASWTARAGVGGGSVAEGVAVLVGMDVGGTGLTVMVTWAQVSPSSLRATRV